MQSAMFAIIPQIQNCSQKFITKKQNKGNESHRAEICGIILSRLVRVGLIGKVTGTMKERVGHVDIWGTAKAKTRR